MARWTRATWLMGWGLAACGPHREPWDETLTATESTLIESYADIGEVEERTERNLENPLSGSDPTTPDVPLDVSATDEQMASTLKDGPAAFFEPASCITSSFDHGVGKYLLQGCRSRIDLRAYDGAITSTWTRTPDGFVVSHEAVDFWSDDMPLTYRATIAYSFVAGSWTKRRSASWSGETARGIPFTRQLDDTRTVEGGCVTRDGRATTRTSGKVIETTVTHYRRCGASGCPTSGKITIVDEAGALQMEIEFIGGRTFRIRRSTGAVVVREAMCSP